MTESVDPRPPKTATPFTGATIVFIGLLVGTGLIGFLLAKEHALASWLSTLGFMAALVIAAGYNIKKLYFGFLIDHRNRYSLSRLQTLVWTLIILSAFLTATFINLHGEAADPVAIAVPEQLWVLMGISIASLLGSPVLLGQKRKDGQDVAANAARASSRKRTTTKKTARKTTRSTSEAPKDKIPDDHLVFDGILAQKPKPADASWSDLFKGEAGDRAYYLDMTRVQMFFFNLILLIAYSFFLGKMFAGHAAGTGYATIDALPPLSAGMLALLGISHTGYLGGKALPAKAQSVPPNSGV